jgi:ATP-dependent Clp protease ATP-binding subunit ClpC
MFERFTDRSRAAVVSSQDEARGLKHDYIGTEHLLLALIGLEDGVSREVLTSRGYDIEKLREGLDVGNKDLVNQHSLPFTPRAKKVIELALREALQYGHRVIDDYHLLLGILRMEESTALSMLSHDNSSATIYALRAAILESPQVAVPSQTTHTTGCRSATVPSSKAALLTRITDRLESKSEAELQSLLDSLD